MNHRILHSGIAITLLLMSFVAHGAIAATAPSPAKGVRQAQPKLTEREKEIARKLAAKEPLRNIITYYAAKGVAITDTVYSAIKAGADPGTLVYTAILEGYSARPVVSYALRAGASLNVVVDAALGAGADKRFIYLGATDAGFSVGAIASAVASNAAPAANNSGPAPFIASSGPVYIPAAPVTIGGGGGGTPSTIVASPYRP